MRGDIVDGQYRMLHADALEALRGMPDASVDAVVTDPPAGISFMSKAWDTPDGGNKKDSAHTGEAARDAAYDSVGKGASPFGISGAAIHSGTKARREFVARMTPIFVECLRVLKPGGRALVWSIPRTSHWTATAIEDAGFLIENEIADIQPADPVIAAFMGSLSDGQRTAFARVLNSILPAKLFQIFGSGFPKGKSQLKPAIEGWILARKPGGKVPPLQIDRCRVSAPDGVPRFINRADPSVHTFGDGVSGSNRTGEIDASTGRWPPNLLFSHVPPSEDSPGCVEVGTRAVGAGERVIGGPPRANRGEMADRWNTEASRDRSAATMNYGTETIAAWRCVDGCPVAELNRQEENCARFFPQFAVDSEAWEKTQQGASGASNKAAGIDNGARLEVAASTRCPSPDGSGSANADLSPTATTSTTSTATRPTTGSKTSRASLPLFTAMSTDASEKITASSMASSSDAARSAESIARSTSSTNGRPEPIRDIASPASVPQSPNGSAPTGRAPPNSSASPMSETTSTLAGRIESVRRDPLDDVTPFLYAAKAPQNQRFYYLTCNCQVPSVDTWGNADQSPRAPTDTMLRARGTSEETSAEGCGSLTLLNGSEIGDQSQPDSKFTISTKTSKTTRSKTSHSSMPPRTSDSIPAANFGTVCGGSPVASVESLSQSTKSTSTSVARDGRSMGVAVPATFAKSLKGTVCSRCGGQVEASAHPTQKGQQLMRWLCRLITPPGGLVLDPFAGSGSTGVACVSEGFSFIGVEREAEYVAIARARIDHAIEKLKPTSSQ